MNKSFRNVCVAIISLLSIASCTPPNGGIQNLYSDDGIVMTETLHKTIDAINQKDKITLREMFSQKALSDSENFEKGLEYLFDFIDGKIIKYPKEEHPYTSISYNQGQKQKVARIWDFFETDQGTKYRYCIVKYIDDTKNPENIGIYMLQVIDPDKETEQFDGGNDKLYPGIYIPE